MRFYSSRCLFTIYFSISLDNKIHAATYDYYEYILYINLTNPSYIIWGCPDWGCQDWGRRRGGGCGLTTVVNIGLLRITCWSILWVSDSQVALVSHISRSFRYCMSSPFSTQDMKEGNIDDKDRKRRIILQRCSLLILFSDKYKNERYERIMSRYSFQKEVHCSNDVN